MKQLSYGHRELRGLAAKQGACLFEGVNNLVLATHTVPVQLKHAVHGEDGGLRSDRNTEVSRGNRRASRRKTPHKVS